MSEICRQCQGKKVFKSLVMVDGSKVEFPIDCPDCNKEEVKETN